MGQHNTKSRGYGEATSLDESRLTASGRKLLVQALSVHEDDESELTNGLSGDNPVDGQEGLIEDDRVKLAGNEEQDLKERLGILQHSYGNEICADCPEPSSTWVSVTFGVFLCAQCVGAHRSLGANVSFTRSTTLDEDWWTKEEVDKLENMGNVKSNARLEYYVPNSWPKPDEETPGSYRREYIQAKYENKLFSKAEHSSMRSLGPTTWSKRKTMLDRTKSTTQEGKIEFIGIVSIKVLCAKHLTPITGPIPVINVPAFYTNPYCCVKLGKHEAKTKVVNRSINPTWNEGPTENVSLNMSWDGRSILKLAVWGNDKLAAKDKIIGSALVDIGELKSNALKDSKHRIWVSIFDYRGVADSTIKEEGFGGHLNEDDDLEQCINEDQSAFGHHPKVKQYQTDENSLGEKRAAPLTMRSASMGGVSDASRIGIRKSCDAQAGVSRIGISKSCDAQAGVSKVKSKNSATTVTSSGSSKGSEQVVAKGHGSHSREISTAGSDTDVDEDLEETDWPSPIQVDRVHIETEGSGDASSQHKTGKHHRKRSFTKFHFRDKMKGAMVNLKTAISRQTSQMNLEDSDEDEELSNARRSLGYYFAGKVEVELSFLDLR